MKRIDALFILILFVVGFLGLAYWHTSTSPEYIDNSPEKLAKFKRQIELRSLKKEIAKIESNQKRSLSRDIASVEIEEDLRQLPSALDTAVAARKKYSEVREACFDPTKEMECLNKIELVISQFPESVWAAESLIILTEIYRRNNRDSQAHELLNVIKHEFKTFPNIQSKADQLEESMKL